MLVLSLKFFLFRRIFMQGVEQMLYCSLIRSYCVILLVTMGSSRMFYGNKTSSPVCRNSNIFGQVVIAARITIIIQRLHVDAPLMFNWQLCSRFK
jgi:hypothetical protein